MPPILKPPVRERVIGLRGLEGSKAVVEIARIVRKRRSGAVSWDSMMFSFSMNTSQIPTTASFEFP